MQRFIIHQHPGDICPEDAGKWFVYDTQGKGDNDINGDQGPFDTLSEALLCKRGIITREKAKAA